MDCCLKKGNEDNCFHGVARLSGSLGNAKAAG